MNFNFIIYFILFLFFLFSINAEINCWYDAFSEGKYNSLKNNDDITSKESSLLKSNELIKDNIRVCAHYFQSSVRWRRCYMVTFLSIVIIFMIIGRIPTLREITLSTILLFVLNYSIWQNFSNLVANKSCELIEENLKNLN